MKDRFSSLASGYAQFRPTYPAELYQWLLARAPHGALAWDVGTGNGQAAAALAPYFAHIWATDISPQQLAQAPALPNVTYCPWPAECTQIPPHSVQLVVAAQAAHWFDWPRFAAEVQRVAALGARLAVWGYGLLQLPNPAAQHALQQLYAHTLGPHWDAERRHIDQAYRSLPVPFAQVAAAGFQIAAPAATLGWLAGYLNTWSALKNYREATQHDPLPSTLAELAAALGDTPFCAHFPVFMRLFEVGP